MNCGVGCRHGLDPELLWHGPVTTALIGPLAWEPPYAIGVVLKKKDQKKKKSENGRHRRCSNEYSRVEQEFLMWCNKIIGIRGVLGRRFSPQPSIVG